MCGGGVGSANNEDNDDEKGSGNSFKETLANIFTPGDGMSYVDGRLTENNSSRDPKFYDYNPNNKSDDGPGYTTIYKDGKKTQVRKDANDRYKGRLLSGVMGAMSGGIPGILGSLATNELTRGAVGQGIMGVGETAGDAASSLKGLFATPEFKTEEEKVKYEKNRSDQLRAHYASIPGAGGDGNSGVSTAAVAPTVSLPGSNMPPPSNMSVSANQAFQPIPNPDYDPNDPMSQKFLSNPTYAQLLAYQQSQVPGMAQGGMLGAALPQDQRYYDQKYPSQGLTNPQGSAQRFMGNPLEQYGGYLEQKYGDPSFDQKRDGFLQEVLQKEQQTFTGAQLTPQLPSATQQLPSSDPVGFPFNHDVSRTPSIMELPFPQNLQRSSQPMNYAEGGELGGNEKTAISDAISAVKGQMPEEQAAIALGMFVQNYGEEALKNLIERVQSGEFDDTVDRFANGEAGEVVGPGDGSGVDDKVPASLEGQQDVLLADGEFVLRKKTADALEKKYGGGFLDTVNEAEDNAPRTMQEYMARA